MKKRKMKKLEVKRSERIKKLNRLKSVKEFETIAKLRCLFLGNGHYK